MKVVEGSIGYMAVQKLIWPERIRGTNWPDSNAEAHLASG